jgi:hypothetical protein
VDRVIQKKPLQYLCHVAVHYMEDILVENLNVALKTKYPLKCIKKKITKNKIFKINWAPFLREIPLFHYKMQTDIVLLLHY